VDRKKKIVFTVTTDLSYDQRMQRICTSMAAYGFDVELVGRLRSKSIPLDELSYTQTRIACKFEKGILFYLEFNIRLFLFLLKHEADIVSAVDVDTLLACTLVAKMRNKTLVFDAHEYYTESPEIVNRPIIKWIWEAVSELCIPRADAAYTVGPMLAELMGKKYDIHFSFVRNVPFSIKTSNQQIQKSSIHKIILYQGAMNRGRGIEESILAMKQVNAELWLAGDGDILNELQLLVKENQLNDKVKFLGCVKPSELKTITEVAYLGLNLLQPIGLSYYYSLANKFFDYMQQGIPCISANFPEYQAINEQYNCTLLSSCDVDEIADSMNQLLNDGELIQRLKENCLKAKEDFCWEKEEQKLIEIYRKLN
jgi:glycosyltransferase involved in cell wall biosynthesis